MATEMAKTHRITVDDTTYTVKVYLEEDPLAVYRLDFIRSDEDKPSAVFRVESKYAHAFVENEEFLAVVVRKIEEALNAQS